MSSSQFAFTLDQARTMLLAAQGFYRASPEPVTALEVLECIQRMGILQIDTIHVIARSPYLVLWSRLGNYEPALLEGLLSDAHLFEYWSHEACFIPIEDFAIYRRFMLDASKHKGRFTWLEQNREAAGRMLDHVRTQGPTRSSDFERQDGRKGNWWDWKQEKIALDFLHTSGELMIAKRDKFQRIYDLREKVLPGWSDQQCPSTKEATRQLVEKTVRALGVAASGWCADYYRLAKKDVTTALADLEEEGRIIRGSIEGIAGDAFFSNENLDLASRIQGSSLTIGGSTLLSPFDPIVWDRRRALELFGFDYRIECYVPERKRKYGYFVLPILAGNRIVGRLDAKAHRKDGLFEVKRLFVEAHVLVEDELVAAIGSAIRRCADWHQTPKVKITKADRPKLAARIQKAVGK